MDVDVYAVGFDALEGDVKILRRGNGQAAFAGHAALLGLVGVHAVRARAVEDYLDGGLPLVEGVDNLPVEFFRQPRAYFLGNSPRSAAVAFGAYAAHIVVVTRQGNFEGHILFIIYGLEGYAFRSFRVHLLVEGRALEELHRFFMPLFVGSGLEFCEQIVVFFHCYLWC